MEALLFCDEGKFPRRLADFEKRTGLYKGLENIDLPQLRLSARLKSCEILGNVVLLVNIIFSRGMRDFFDERQGTCFTEKVAKSFGLRSLVAVRR